MCQYDSRCRTRRHNLFTRCPYTGRSGPGRVVVAVALAAVAAAAYIGPSTIREAFDNSPSPRQKSAQVRVLRAVDGDTIRVSLGGNDVRVRLLGIDSPEVGRDGKPGECFGVQATRQLEDLAPAGSRVVLTSDPSQGDTDQWGRLLRYVEVDGVDINEQLLRRGAAERYVNRPPLDRTKSYDQAAAKARNARAGLWGSC